MLSCPTAPGVTPSHRQCLLQCREGLEHLHTLVHPVLLTELQNEGKHHAKSSPEDRNRNSFALLIT